MKLFQYLILFGALIMQAKCCGDDSGNGNGAGSGNNNGSPVTINNSTLMNSSVSYGVYLPPSGSNRRFGGSHEHYVNLFKLQEDATHDCISVKGVSIPPHYCEVYGGEPIVGGSRNENHVCCSLNVTEEIMDTVSPIVKNNDRFLQHSDFLELRSNCGKSKGLVSHYCKEKSQNCQEPHAHIGFDYFEWSIIGEGLSKWGNITSGDTIALEADEHYLKCYTRKCHIKKLGRKCRFDSEKSKAWGRKACKPATYKIYSYARQGNCTFDNDIECKGDVIRQGDEVILKSLSKSGNYVLSNNPSNNPLSDVVLMNDKSKGYNEKCSIWTVQSLSEMVVYSFANL